MGSCTIGNHKTGLISQNTKNSFSWKLTSLISYGQLKVPLTDCRGNKNFLFFFLLFKFRKHWNFDYFGFRTRPKVVVAWRINTWSGELFWDGTSGRVTRLSFANFRNLRSGVFYQRWSSHLSCMKDPPRTKILTQRNFTVNEKWVKFVCLQLIQDYCGDCLSQSNTLIGLIPYWFAVVRVQ